MVGLFPFLARRKYVPTDRGAGCVFWLDPDAGSITLVSGLASQCLDKSGTTKTATQGTAGLRFGYTAANAAYNNKPTLDGTGTQWLRTSAFTSIPQPFTVYVVCHATGAAATNGIVGSDSPECDLYISATGRPGCYAGSGDLHSTGLATSKSVVCWIPHSGLTAVYVNNSSANLISGNAGSNGLTQLRIGSLVGGVVPIIGSIAQVVIYTGHDTLGQRQQQFGAFAEQFAIAAA